MKQSIDYILKMKKKKIIIIQNVKTIKQKIKKLKERKVLWMIKI
jgi:hypothetical protein